MENLFELARQWNQIEDQINQLRLRQRKLAGPLEMAASVRLLQTGSLSWEKGTSVVFIGGYSRGKFIVGPTEYYLDLSELVKAQQWDQEHDQER